MQSSLSMPSLFSRSKKSEEAGRVRLFYGHPRDGMFVDNMSIGQAFSLQANARLAGNLLGENEDKNFRNARSLGPSDEASTVKWLAPTPVKQAGQGRPEEVAESPRQDPATPAAQRQEQSPGSSIPPTQPPQPLGAEASQEEEGAAGEARKGQGREACKQRLDHCCSAEDRRSLNMLHMAGDVVCSRNHIDARLQQLNVQTKWVRHSLESACSLPPL